jgi:2-oxoglutarate dehydrogenase E1 component
MSGVVVNLPHGYEGQGPEHSNAYLERFLALSAEDNIQVAVPTTAGQYFHLLRRQIHRKFRKPLFNFMPKSLLRFEPSSSRIEELTDGSFHTVIDDPAAPPDRNRVRRVLLCSGKVYYTLAQAREKSGRQNEIAIVRVEQLYPFPEAEIRATLARYGRAAEVCWVQEEPQNRGAWRFIDPRLRAMFPYQVDSYIGRDEAASPAVGSMKMHQVEEAELVSHAMALPPRDEPVKEAVKQAPAAAPAAQQVDG